MKHPFTAPSIKTRRARKHLAELEEEVATFLAGGPAKFDASATTREGVRGVKINADTDLHSLRRWFVMSAREAILKGAQGYSP
jgi:hypothetical protein